MIFSPLNYANTLLVGVVSQKECRKITIEKKFASHSQNCNHAASRKIASCFFGHELRTSDLFVEKQLLIVSWERMTLKTWSALSTDSNVLDHGKNKFN